MEILKIIFSGNILFSIPNVFENENLSFLNEGEEVAYPYLGQSRHFIFMYNNIGEFKICMVLYGDSFKIVWGRRRVSYPQKLQNV